MLKHVHQCDEAMRTLREKAAKTARIRRELSLLEISEREREREAKRDTERLRGILDGLPPQAKTIY
ncbi:hypothetical protein [Pseudomonas monsensis]